MNWQMFPGDIQSYRNGLHFMMRSIYAEVKFGIEIGLGWGVSAKCFLDQFPKAQLLSFDINPNLEAIGILKKQYGDRFHFEHAFSKGLPFIYPCQWLYIDGDHSEVGVWSDLRYVKHLERGGVLAFDDYQNRSPEFRYPDVSKVAGRFLELNRDKFLSFTVLPEQFETGPAFTVKIT